MTAAELLAELRTAISAAKRFSTTSCHRRKRTPPSWRAKAPAMARWSLRR